MSRPERIDLPKLENHNCFACGAANPIGLNLHFYYIGESICADVTLGPYYYETSRVPSS